MDDDEGDQKEAIISILEDWAAWERTLEEEEATEAGKNDGVTTATDPEPPAEVIPAGPAAASRPNNGTENRPHANGTENSQGQRIVEESRIESTPTVTSRPASKRTPASSDTYPTGSSNQLLYASRRERRRAERHDPVARARRQALKVWAADQTRRRSSASEASVSESLRRQGAGSLKEWAAFNSRSSRRSSADATIDHNRKGAESSSGNEWYRTKKPPPRVFAPRQMSVQRDIRNTFEVGLEPRKSPRLAAAGHPKQRAMGGKAGQRPRNSHPWRENMKAPQERSGRLGPGIAREGDAPTAPSTPRSPAAAALSSPPSSSSMVGGRGSPWARSPSRETAGGILVNHCFFYGSSGKATSPKAVAATTAPSFESKWMRQFREEVSSNPNWWLGSDRFVLGRVTSSNPGNLRGGGNGSTGRPAGRTTQVSITRGKGSRSRADRTTDLWQEVRSLLAAGRHGGATHASGGEPDREHGDDHTASTPGGVDLLSFGDRLRYTPLSQGAWLVGRAAAAAAIEQQPKSAGSHSTEGRLTIATAAVDGVAANGIEVDGKEAGKREAGLDAAVPGQTAAGEDHSLGEKVGGHSDVSAAKAPGGGKRRSSRQDLQGLHAATLAKLRGEIDPFTREELVLRAAEEARGALARERARSTSPRRASAGVFRPSSHRTRRGDVPDSIDYDKVEATLSLIELATRAAGPDAGKQMLQALEGLDKMHQRVSEEKDTTGGGRRRLDGGQGSTRPNEARSIAVADKISERKGSGAAAAGVSSAATGRAPAIADGERSPGAAAQDGSSAASPRRLSRKFSLAVSSSSEESAAGSEASSVGIIQSIGNWLWSNTSPPTLSRRNSQSSDLQAADESESGPQIGLSEFPAALEESDVSEPIEAKDEASRTGSSDDDKQADQDTTAEGKASSASGGGQEDHRETEEPSGRLDSASAVESFDAERPTSNNTPHGQRGDGRQDEERVSDVATGMVEGQESTSAVRAAQRRPPDKPPPVKARRKSEADKPSGFPQLEKDIARAKESTSDAEESACEASRSSQSNTSAAAVSVSNLSVFLAPADVSASVGEQERISTGGADLTWGTGESTHTEQPRVPTTRSQAGLKATQGQGSTHKPRVGTEPEPPAEGVSLELPPGATENGKAKAEKPGQRAADTINGDTAEGTGGTRAEGVGGGSLASPLLHRDSWFSVGTRPRRGNFAVPKQESEMSEMSAVDAQGGGRGEEWNQASPGAAAVGAGRDQVANGKRATSRHNGSPGGRYAPWLHVPPPSHYLYAFVICPAGPHPHYD